MSVNSKRTTLVTFTGDVQGTQTETATNASSPGSILVMDLGVGPNTITVPAAGTVPTAVTIVKPSDNAETLTLKGVTGDTGVKLHPTDPDTVSLDPSQATFVITSTGTVTGLRLIWS